MKITAIILSLLVTLGLSAQSKLFKSKTLPITISYPAGWKVEEESSVTVNRLDEKGYIRIREMSSNGHTSAEKLLDAINKANYTGNLVEIKKGESDINGEKALFIEANYKENETAELHYAVQKAGKCYYLYFSGYKINKEEAIKIITSFKIL